MVLKKVFAANISMIKALASSYVFLVEFSYFVALNNMKNKKQIILNTTISYFMMIWFFEYIKILGARNG